MRKLTATLMASAMAFGLGTGAFAQTMGVTDDEIVIGSVNDLSGIFAAVGVPAVNGANMRIDELNEAGGVHGRKIRFIVEDNGYQIPRAMQGYNKLVNKDGVFAMLLSLGTPMNIAGFKLLDPKGIPNVSPLSSASQMLMEPMQEMVLLVEQDLITISLVNMEQVFNVLHHLLIQSLKLSFYLKLLNILGKVLRTSM